MTGQPSRFSMLAEMSDNMSSTARRELLRKVTETIGQGPADNDGEIGHLDELLANLAADYAVQVRAELAQLISANPQFSRSANQFALDDIEVAGPILKHSNALSEATLLRVIAKKSQAHMMAVTQRRDIGPTVSYALAEAGDDQVVASLLSNAGAKIAPHTFEAVSARAQTSAALQAPLIRRKDVPVELLNDLYFKVETGLRLEIVTKYNSVSSEEIDRAFQRSRERATQKTENRLPDDFKSAQARIDDLARRGFLTPPSLVTLLREGAKGRTAFLIAFAQLADVDFDLVQRTIANFDMDTIALLCRGAGFVRPLYVTLAIALKKPDDREGPTAEVLGDLYERVPVEASKRALRFWKVRAAA